MTTIITSAPAKVILLGEHSVNRQQPALATAVDMRLYCHVSARQDDHYTFRAGTYRDACSRVDLLADKTQIDELRRRENYDEIREVARTFFAPTRYVLAHVWEDYGGPGLDVEWRSSLPIGSGLGSGAAASSALALAACQAAGHAPDPAAVAFLAWQGDIIAHGGIASGLDSGACALGGVTRYTLADGPQTLSYDLSLPLVIGDTGVQANTADINTRVRRWLAAHPARMHLFVEMGLLVQQAQAALERADLQLLGHLLNLNQLLLEKLGVSSSELESLIEAALDAGALGAKLSGSGGGGIMIALTTSERQQDVAEAITAAGGRAYRVLAGAAGVRAESAGIA